MRKVEADQEWVTASGLIARARFMEFIKAPELDHWSGYVEVRVNNTMYGKEYNKDENGEYSMLNMDCHGGLTYGEYMDGIENGWWFGFDCGHDGDTVDICNIEYVRRECEKLAWQLKQYDKSMIGELFEKLNKPVDENSVAQILKMVDKVKMSGLDDFKTMYLQDPINYISDPHNGSGKTKLSYLKTGMEGAVKTYLLEDDK